MNKKQTLALLTGAALLGGAVTGIAGMVNAQTTTTSSITATAPHFQGQGVFGKVTAVNGTSLTVTGGKDNTAYTVDISQAKITKAAAGAKPTSASATDILVNDMVGVRGTVTGTSVAATEVMDGVMGFGRGMGKGMMGHGVRGTVASVSGSTITLTGKDGKTYTVDASAAKASKVETITTTDIKAGDTLEVMGTVTGTSVTAKNIMDGVPQAPAAQ